MHGLGFKGSGAYGLLGLGPLGLRASFARSIRLTFLGRSRG